jgi:4-hydroxybenzoate polyprenyltransferase
LNSIFKTISIAKLGTVLFAVFYLIFFASFLNNSITTATVVVFSLLVFTIYFPKTRKLILQTNFFVGLFFLVLSCVALYFLSNYLPNYLYLILSFTICFFYFKEIPNTLSLRENYKTKAVSISLSWILLCTGFLSIKVELQNVMPFLLSQFLFVWALTIPFDFADVEQDKKNGTVNYFSAISSKNALIILIVILLFQLLVNFYFFSGNKLFNVINFIQTAACCYLGFKNINKFWFGEMVELAFLLQWLIWETLR